MTFVLVLAAVPVARAQWTEPVAMEPQLGTAVWGPWISNDGLRLYASGGGYLRVIERDSVTGPWHQWRSVAAHINSGTRQESPCESPSGDTLYFMSWERPEGCYGGYDIYYCVRTDTGWGPVINCGPNINTYDTEWSVGISRDGSLLLVSARQLPVSGGLDLYYSEKQPDGTWGPLVHFPAAANSIDNDEHPCLSPDNNRLFWYMAGDRMGDIWASHRVESVWQPKMPLPEPINTIMGGEFDPCLSADGETLWFIRQDSHANNTLLYSRDTTASSSRRRDSSGRTGLRLETQPGGSGDVRLLLLGSNRTGEWEVIVHDLLGRETARSVVAFHTTPSGAMALMPFGDTPSGAYFLTVQFPGQDLRATFNWVK